MEPAGKITIRPAVASDVEAIVALDRGIGELPHWAMAEYRVAVAGADAEPLRSMFVAECEGELAGVAVGKVARIEGHCWGELETVGVAATARRRGVGRRLCCAVLVWCQANGASEVELEVRSRSAGAMALYRELGFEAAGSRRGYYRDPVDDAVLMRLRWSEDRDQSGSGDSPVSCG